MESDGFVPITAIFYAVFHPTEGTKVLNQVPEGSIATTSSSSSSGGTSGGASAGGDGSLFDFNTIKNYIVPKAKFCNRLISIKVGQHKVLGYPVNIENEKYSRNSFSFNFCFVFPYNSDTTPYESAIRRMGKMFLVLEEQSFMLSRLDKTGSFFKDSDQSPMDKSLKEYITPGFRKTQKVSLSSIQSLTHQIFQDLNNYSECCIPLDSANSVDIKLFPILAPPVNIKAFQVPVLTVKLHLLVDINWDPTMLKILPFIDGINSIQRISKLADADYILTKQCIQHLMHYKCITFIDIFQFNGTYAPTNRIGNFLKVEGMTEECQAYVITNELESLEETSSTPEEFDSSSPNLPNSFSPFSKMTKYLETRKKTKTFVVPSKATLFYLYRSFNQGQTVKEWYKEHKKHLANIDIRRFITFGVMRGLIYRVHTYPVPDAITKCIENDNSLVDELTDYFKTKLLIKKNHQSMSTINSSRLQESTKEASLNTITNQSKRKVSFGYNVDVEGGTAGGAGGRPYSIGEELESDVELSGSDSDSNESLPHPDESLVELSSLVWSEKEEDLVKLIKLMRGFQHFDSICTELQKSRTEAEQLLALLGNYDMINS